MRTGLIARKLGMTRAFRDDGMHVPVTVLKVDHCQVGGGQDRRTGRLHRACSSASARRR